MNRRMKVFFCLSLALMLLLTAGCSKKTEVKSFALLIEGAQERGGVMLEGIVPGMSKAEAEAAGMAFGPEPISSDSDPESGRSSESYPVKNAISLGKISFAGSELQFTNGKLVDITIPTGNESNSNALLEQLTKELGEPTVSTSPLNSSTTAEIRQWESDQGDYLLRISHLTRIRSGEPVGSNLQISYLYYDWFPLLKK